MRYLNLLLFLFLDFLVLAFIFLLFSYYGMGHIFVLLLAVVVIALGYYDIKSGKISALMVMLFGLPVNVEGRVKWYNYLPMAAAVALIWYAVNALGEFGLVNAGEQRVMQQGNFWVLILAVLLLSALLTLLALWIYIKEARKK